MPDDDKVKEEVKEEVIIKPSKPKSSKPKVEISPEGIESRRQAHLNKIRGGK